MIRVSAPNKARTFTSGKSYKSTFRLDIQGDVSQYDQLKIEGDLGGYTDNDMAGDINNVLTVEYVSRGTSIPCRVFLPESTSRVQPSFEVHRGPLHPQEVDVFELELTVYGGDGDNWERIGADVVELEG
jgi:hypothetical protein